MDAIAMLGKYTYMVEHQPCCFNPYLVRLMAPNAGALDRLPHTETKDICGYGKTFELATVEVLRKKDALRPLRPPHKQNKVIRVHRRRR